MWRCPVCGQTFTGRNMPHSCQVVPLERHFEGRPPTLRAHLVLTRHIDHPRLTVEYLPPRYHVHRLNLRQPADVDDQVRARLAEAYAVGAQRHLRPQPPPAAPPAPDRPSTGSR